MGSLVKTAKKLINISPRGKEFAIALYERVQKRRYKGYIHRFPVERETVIFEAFLGNQYACSPKALYEAMCGMEKYRNYKKVWMFQNPEAHRELLKNPGTILVKYGSREYYEFYARAGVWITNYRLAAGIEKRPEQIYVQTWHGTPLKKIGCDVESAGISKAQQKRTAAEYAKEGQRADYLPSPSPFYSEKITSAFCLGSQAKILEYGYPRNDALLAPDNGRGAKIRKKLGIPKGKRVILYAPTWRDNQHTAGEGYTYRLGIDFDALKRSLEEDCVILFRAHYLISTRFDFEKFGGFIRNVSDYDDINELYLAADMLITDYSSVFFDYANLERPILFYMYDYEEYKHELRDFYFGTEEFPGPVIQKERDISGDIRDLFQGFQVDETYRAFNNKYNPHRKPCSERVLEEILG